ncbi:MAG: hypothetical protein GXP27_00830 [Planctomycetes bacterium]|nr:hypothetical protein [Planctomycetota bacterium]
MAYCRWSSMDYQCDLYVYHGPRGIVIHVATSHPQFKGPLPPPIPLTKETLNEWLERDAKISEMLKEADHVPIGGPCDGKNWYDLSYPEAISVLESLKEAGYQFPESVINEIRAEAG